MGGAGTIPACRGQLRGASDRTPHHTSGDELLVSSSPPNSSFHSLDVGGRNVCGIEPSAWCVRRFFRLSYQSHWCIVWGDLHSLQVEGGCTGREAVFFTGFPPEGLGWAVVGSIPTPRRAPSDRMVAPSISGAGGVLAPKPGTVCECHCTGPPMVERGLRCTDAGAIRTSGLRANAMSQSLSGGGCKASWYPIGPCLGVAGQDGRGRSWLSGMLTYARPSHSFLLPPPNGSSHR